MFVHLVARFLPLDAAIGTSSSNNVILASLCVLFYCMFVFTRRTLEGPLDVHPSKNAIVVHYDVEAYITTEYGEPIVADRKECKKMYDVTPFIVSNEHSIFVLE